MSFARRTRIRSFITLILFLTVGLGSLWAEIIYTKDGQVLRGAIIKENAASITVKTAYQTKTIPRSQITRIMFGDREMEEIYILFKDDRMLKAYLVDQDNKKVVVRFNKDSSEEKTIPKTEIAQTSNEPIFLYKPQIGAHLGIWSNLNSGNGDLDTSLIYFGSYSFRLPFAPMLRTDFLVGFGQANSGVHSGLQLTMIPFLGRILYQAPFNAAFKGLGMSSAEWAANFFIRIKGGLGSAWNNFDNGEGESSSGFLFIANSGLGFGYSVSRRSLLFVDFDYANIQDSKESMSALWITSGFGLQY